MRQGRRRGRDGRSSGSVVLQMPLPERPRDAGLPRRRCHVADGVGFFLGWLGGLGKGRALGVGEVKFTETVIHTGQARYLLRRVQARHHAQACGRRGRQDRESRWQDCLRSQRPAGRVCSPTTTLAAGAHRSRASVKELATFPPPMWGKGQINRKCSFWHRRKKGTHTEPQSRGEVCRRGTRPNEFLDGTKTTKMRQWRFTPDFSVTSRGSV